MNFNNNEDNSSNGGNKGKFRERLIRIKNERLRFRKHGSIKDNEEEYSIITFGRNIFKIILAFPSVVYSHVIIKDKDKDGKSLKKNNNNKLEKANVDDEETFNILDGNIDIKNNSLNLIDEDINKIKVKKIKEINVLLLKKKREELVNNNNLLDNVKLN